MLIIGAGGFAKQLFEAISPAEHAHLHFYDEHNLEQTYFWNTFPILHSPAEAEQYFRTRDQRFALGVGAPALRARLAQQFRQLGGILSTVVSPHAQVSVFAGAIGAGATILSGAIVEGDTRIGEGCLINLQACITHDTQLGDYCEIAPAAQLLGGCHIGQRCFIGAGAIVLPKVKLGDEVVVGAGAVVTRNVPSGAHVKGIPAKKYNA